MFNVSVGQHEHNRIALAFRLEKSAKNDPVSGSCRGEQAERGRGNLISLRTRPTTTSSRGGRRSCNVVSERATKRFRVPPVDGRVLSPICFTPCESAKREGGKC